MNNNDIVQKLWNLCDVLRDDGINYSDYVTELVLLLFIKMVHENTEADILNQHTLPEGCRWVDLKDESGIDLLDSNSIISKIGTQCTVIDLLEKLSVNQPLSIHTFFRRSKISEDPKV